MNQQTTKYINEVAAQVEMALTDTKTSDAVKDCLKTIIFEAANEAGLPLADFSLIRAALPNIIGNLGTGYGRGFLHSIAAIIRQDTNAYEKFYEQRLDEKTEAEAKAAAPFDYDRIMNETEVEDLVSALLFDAEYHPYAVYGLMFLFSSIKKLIENGSQNLVDNINNTALLKLYSVSFNVDEAIDRATENIHIPYRQADWKNNNQLEIAAPFIAAERSEPGKDETATAAPLETLANQISQVMKNPNLPTHLYNVLSDELATVHQSTDAPENILLNLERLKKEGDR